MDIVIRDVFRLRFTRDGVGIAFSAENSIALNEWTYFAIISASDGTSSIYIGDEDTTPVLSGTADQNAGTPVDGSDLYIGNRLDGSKTVEGAIHGLRIWDLDKINLSPEDLLQSYYESTGMEIPFLEDFEDGNKYLECLSAGDIKVPYSGLNSATMTIKVFDGMWNEYDDTITNLSANSWLSIGDGYLIFTLGAGDRITNIIIKQ